jgi:transposase
MLSARTFDASLTSVKRYLRKFRQGRALLPGKAPGKRPIIDEPDRRLLEEDLKERPFVTPRERCEYLRVVAGLEVSRSVMCRTIKRMDSTRKKGW